jgi:chromosome segregation ATPase
MPSQCPQVPERSSARVNARIGVNSETTPTGVESKLPVVPKRQIAKYCDALNEACITRLDLGQKYNDLQRQCRSLLLDMERNTSDHLGKLDEEILRNDILSFQLGLVQDEAAEHRDAIKAMTEKLKAASQNESNLAGAVKEMESKLTEKNTELALLTSQMTEKDSIIEHLEGTYAFLRNNLRMSNETKRQKITGLKTTISSQFEVIQSLSYDLKVQKQIITENVEQLEREKAAAISDRDAAAAEIHTLNAACKEYESYIDRLQQENKTLEGDFEALIDMSIESEAIDRGYAEENKRLTEEAANLNREMDLIRAALMEHLTGLKPDLSNLSDALSKRSANRRNPKRRCRENSR